MKIQTYQIYFTTICIGKRSKASRCEAPKSLYANLLGSLADSSGVGGRGGSPYNVFKTYESFIVGHVKSIVTLVGPKKMRSFKNSTWTPQEHLPDCDKSPPVFTSDVIAIVEATACAFV